MITFCLLHPALSINYHPLSTGSHFHFLPLALRQVGERTRCMNRFLLYLLRRLFDVKFVHSDRGFAEWLHRNTMQSSDTDLLNQIGAQNGPFRATVERRRTHYMSTRVLPPSPSCRLSPARPHPSGPGPPLAVKPRRQIGAALAGSGSSALRETPRVTSITVSGGQDWQCGSHAVAPDGSPPGSCRRSRRADSGLELLICALDPHRRGIGR
jgi:hypothetical protein